MIVEGTEFTEHNWILAVIQLIGEAVSDTSPDFVPSIPLDSGVKDSFVLLEVDENRIEGATEHSVERLRLLKPADQIDSLQGRCLFAPALQNADQLVPIDDHLPPSHSVKQLKTRYGG